MPIISSFSGVAARGFGFTNGLPPVAPSSISFTPSALNAVVTFTTSPTSYPVDYVQAKIMQGATLISDWATVTSSGNISASDLTPAVLYTVYFRTRDTGGQISEETSQTFTTSAETAPGAPTFSLAVASGNAGTFKFNITSTGGTVGTYSRTTQYRVENSAGTVVLTDWTTISSGTNTVTAYGADTYDGSGALSPATTYRVRLRSVAATSGTITYTSYSNITTNAIVAPGAPTFSSAPAAVSGTAGEFSFTFTPANGSANSYPVASTRYRIRTNNTVPYTYVTGYSTFTVATGATTIGTSTYVSAILSPGTTYYVDIQTYDTQGTTSSITSASVTTAAKRNPTAGSVTVAAPTYTGTNTSSLNATPSSFTAGSWPISYYQASTDNSTWSTLSGNSVGGLSADTAYTIYVRAVDTQGNVSSSVSGSATTNSPVPDAPTLYWNNMTSTSVGTANLYLSIPSYSSTYWVEYSSDGFTTSSTVQISTYYIGYIFGAIGSQPYNSTMQYRAYVRNKHGASGQSAYSNTRVWITPKKNQAWDSGYIQSSAIYFSTTSTCTSEFKYTFGSVPSTDDEVGYIAVTGLYVEGIQQTGSNLNGCSATQTLANTSYLWWQSDSLHPQFTGGLGTTLSSGFSPNWSTGSFASRSVSLSSWGGSNISGKFFSIGTNVGSRTGGCAVGCSVTSGTLNAYRMKNFLISGVQTTGGLAY